MRSDRARLLDILDAIADIARQLPSDRSAFEASELAQVWCVHRLQIIGEAARGLSAAFRGRHPDIPWRAIVGMRNHLMHSYFEVDSEIVWVAVSERVPSLRLQVEAALHTDPEVRESS